MEGYYIYITQFYANPENLSVPLFFAIKIADLAKTGTPEAMLQNYKLVVMQKLKGIVAFD